MVQQASPSLTRLQREAREEPRLTAYLNSLGRGARKALAKAAGVSRQTVYAAEQGLLGSTESCKRMLRALDAARLSDEPVFTLEDLTYAVKPLRQAHRSENGARKRARA